MISIRTQEKEIMNIQLIIILTILALVVPLSIAMFYVGLKQTTTETDNSVTKEFEPSIINNDRSEILATIKKRIEQFKLSKDDAYIYIAEGKFSLCNSEINDILKSVK